MKLTSFNYYVFSEGDVGSNIAAKEVYKLTNPKKACKTINRSESGYIFLLDELLKAQKKLLVNYTK